MTKICLKISCLKFHSTWWRHQMETFSALLTLCARNSPVPVNSPHKGQWRGALMFSLICARINDWVNNREAGDLRRHGGHYGVNVMKFPRGQCVNSLITMSPSSIVWPRHVAGVAYRAACMGMGELHTIQHIESGSTYRVQNKTVDHLHATSSNAFSWMKFIVFLFDFTEVCDMWCNWQSIIIKRPNDDHIMQYHMT